jgi:hypothetical protein
MMKVDRLGWAVGFALASYGVRIGIRSNDRAALTRVLELLPGKWERADLPVVDRVYSILNGGVGPRANLRRFNLLYVDHIVASVFQRDPKSDQRRAIHELPRKNTKFDSFSKPVVGSMKSRDVLRKGKLVATVLSGAWRSAPFPLLTLSASELDEISPLLCVSGAAALAWRRISNTDLRQASCAEVLHQAYRLQALQTAIHEQHLEKVFRLLRAASVDAVLVKGVIERWPDLITATFNLHGKFNNFPRLPYQFADFVLLVTRYLFQLPTKLQVQR